MKVANTLVVILCCLVTSGLSQEQVIDESTFNAAMRRSTRPVREWQGKARRISKTIEEEFSNLPGLNHLYEEVTEFDASGSSRSLWKIIGPQGRKSEMIKIGSTTFTRKGIDNWSKKEAPVSEGIKPNLPFESSDAVDPKSHSSWNEPGSSVEYKLRISQHKGADLAVYRRVIRSIQIHPKDGSEINKEAINHFWIGDDGRLVKFEQWVNYNGKHFHGTQKTVWEWELDPKIIITAPVVLP